MKTGMRDGLRAAMKATRAVKVGYERKFTQHLGGSSATSSCRVCTEFQGAVQACEDVLSDLSTLLRQKAKAKRRRSSTTKERK